MAAKRKARYTWQKKTTRQIAEDYTIKQATNLNERYMQCGMHPLQTVSHLKRDDNSIWKPIKKNKNRPQTSFPPIRKYTTPPGSWAKSDNEKADLFADHLLGVFSPHNTDLDQDVERDLETPVQLSERLKAFSLQELTKEIKLLNPRRAPGMDLITAQMVKELQHEGLLNLLYIQSVPGGMCQIRESVP